ncbi:radical SAM protein [Candidatus Woesearchaeota archaeon]|nr:radical SAM protein [Candidatus Woesearchaeota archaeon]
MSHEEKYEKALEQRIEKVISKNSPVYDYLHKVKEGGKEIIQKVMFYSFVGLLNLISYSNNPSAEVKKPRDERANFSEQEKEVLSKYSMWYSLVEGNAGRISNIMSEKITAKSEEKEFFIQWHLTDRCDLRCKHCYIPHTIKSGALRPELSTEKVKEIIDQYSTWLSEWRIRGEINFSGGNPLMYESFFDLARYTSNKGIRVNVLGNPTSLLEKETLLKLKEVKVSKYQVSIDGLEENHEKIRGEGSYEIAMNGLENLIHYHIDAVVSSTVIKENYKDLPLLTEILIRKGVFLHGFSRVIPTGEGARYSQSFFTPQEYRSFMYEMHNTYVKLRKEGLKFNTSTKDPLWALLFYELGLITPTNHHNLICGGCSVGMNGLTIDVDGTVYSCRRLEIPLGNVGGE